MSKFYSPPHINNVVKFSEEVKLQRKFVVKQNWTWCEKLTEEFMLNIDLSICKNAKEMNYQQLTNNLNTNTEVLDLLSFLFMKVLRQLQCELRYSTVR